MQEHDTVDESNNITAIIYGNDIVGVASYDNIRNTIYADSVAISKNDIEDVFHSIKILCNPSFIIAHPKIVENSSMLHLLLKSNEGVADHYPFKVEKRSSWNAEHGL